VRPYRCGVCDIGFKLKVHLKKHNLYRHSEEYPCECSICGKRFKDSSAVRLHERIHSTARPFQCLHCGKSFKTRENLWGHRNRGPCDQRTVLPPATSLTGVAAAPQFVASNVRLFHSAEFGPILGVPVNTKLVLKDGEKVDERATAVSLNTNSRATTTSTTASFSLLTGSSATNRRRVSAVRVGDTTRLAVSKTQTNTSSVGGLSVVSVPTAVVTPIKREMITDDKLSGLVATTSASVLAGNLVLSATTGHVIDRKRTAIDSVVMSPHKYLAVASEAVDKVAAVQRLLSPPAPSPSDDTLLSPDTEQSLEDALSALVGSDPEAMVVEGDCLPPIGETEPDWPPSADYDDELDVRGEDWSELVAASCDQLLTSTDDDDALSDGEYQRLMPPPCLGRSPVHSPAGVDADSQPVSSEQLASDTMWCNWAPENDLGSLLIFGP